MSSCCSNKIHIWICELFGEKTEGLLENWPNFKKELTVTVVTLADLSKSGNDLTQKVCWSTFCWFQLFYWWESVDVFVFNDLQMLILRCLCPHQQNQLLCEYVWMLLINVMQKKATSDGSSVVWLNIAFFLDKKIGKFWKV